MLSLFRFRYSWSRDSRVLSRFRFRYSWDSLLIALYAPFEVLVLVGLASTMHAFSGFGTHGTLAGTEAVSGSGTLGSRRY